MKKLRGSNWMSVSEILTLLPLSREGFYRRLQAGKIPHARFGRKILVNLNEVLDAMRVTADEHVGGNGHDQ